MHVELRYCDGFKLCLCGITIQYRQDIYLYHNCGGWQIDGFVYGNGESMYLSKHKNSFSAEFKHVSSNYMSIQLLYNCFLDSEFCHYNLHTLCTKSLVLQYFKRSI